MCGIFALLNNIHSHKHIDYNTINNEFMKGKSRGPEHSILESVSIDLLFGFHRLAINGLNPASNQPMKINNIILICNGEIYNYKELYKLLNITPNTASDCEVIIHLYEKFGIEYTLQLLDGVFAFILVDNNPENTNLYVARDPYGVRPLYIVQNIDKTKVVGFSSEMKCLQELSKNYGNNYKIDFFEPGTYSKYNYPSKILSKWTFIENKPYILQSCFASTLSYFCENDHSFIDFEKILYGVRNLLINSVYKRCYATHRPVACLLSGGLDSSLITSIVCKYRKFYNLPPVETYAIGLNGSEDLKYAENASKFLKTNHKSIIIEDNDFINAIPEVIHAIESYDTTTVRASIGNYLVSKYISNNSKAKVIFNGDGSDELFGGYLYFHNSPNAIEFDRECRRLLKNIHKYDVLRSDKSISSNGLEPRTPFLDRCFVQYVLSIPAKIRALNFQKGYDKFKYVEKYLLRYAFDKEICNYEYLPDDILWRTKEAFSDGVSSRKNSLFEIIEKFVETKYTNEDLENAKEKYKHNTPTTKEQLYYRDIFESHYADQGHIIPEFWMPRFVDAKDPSARTLRVYYEENVELRERSL